MHISSNTIPLSHLTGLSEKKAGKLLSDYNKSVARLEEEQEKQREEQQQEIQVSHRLYSHTAGDIGQSQTVQSHSRPRSVTDCTVTQQEV